jgi:hypothetical protein
MRALGLFVCASIVCVCAEAGAAPTPNDTTERVVLRTVAGDLSFTTNDSASARWFVGVIRSGGANGTSFTRLQPGSFADWSLGPMSSMSTDAVPPPSTVTHDSETPRRGALALAPDGTVELFLGPWTGEPRQVIAHLEAGDAVLDQLASVPRDRRGRPQRPLTVTRAEVHAESISVEDLHLAPPRRVHRARPASVLGASVIHDRRPRARSREQPIFFGVALIVLVGAAKVLWRRRLPRRHAVSLDLVMITIGFVLLLMMRVPIGSPSGFVGTLLFVGMAALYRLLGHFEEPSDREPA